MVYEFWDIRTHNLIATFDSELEALGAVREIAQEQGERALEFLMVIEDDYDNDKSRVVGIGLELQDLAKSTA